MHIRISLLILVGILVATSIHYGADYYAWQNRPRPASIVRDEEVRSQIAVDIAALRSRAKTEDEKVYAAFLERSFQAGSMGAELQTIRLSDGVDRYEAWTLARSYALAAFGSCGSVGVPKEAPGRWSIIIGVGSSGQPHTLEVGRVDGAVSCAGQRTLSAQELVGGF